MRALETSFTIACPAFPANGRAVFRGYLFAGDLLLNESGMQNHPLKTMTDANLVRVLQNKSTQKIGLIRHESVSQGAAEIERAFAEAQRQGTGIAIVDAIYNTDLIAIGRACRDLPLVTGGSGLGIGLAENFRAQGLLAKDGDAGRLPHVDGFAAVISGSCSLATQRQVAAMKNAAPAFQIDPRRLAAGGDVVAEAVEWASPRLSAGPVLIYATANAAEVRVIQQQLGAERAGALVESALAAIACQLTALGVRRLIVAGGETAGAVVGALKVSGLRIGKEIDPGVPWTTSIGQPPLALALKSGNFGADDFFLKAWSTLP